jgi:hypothetical protein
VRQLTSAHRHSGYLRGQGTMNQIRPGGLSHETSDDFQFDIPCLVRSHDRHAAVSFDGAAHPDRRQFVDGFSGLRYGATGAVTKPGRGRSAALGLARIIRGIDIRDRERSLTMHLNHGWTACPGIVIHLRRGFAVPPAVKAIPFFSSSLSPIPM